MQILNVLTRVYLQPDALIPMIAFYEGLFGEKCRLRFIYPAMRLELAQVGSMLLIAGAMEDLEPFKATQVTLGLTVLQRTLCTCYNHDAPWRRIVLPYWQPIP